MRLKGTTEQKIQDEKTKYLLHVTTIFLLMDINIKTISEHSSFPKDKYDTILNSLPYIITVQETATQKIVYENKKALELIGKSYVEHPCFTRWKYIEGWGNKPCKDCVLKFIMRDGKKHSTIRKTQDRNGKEILLHIELIPINEIVNEEGKFKYYIELMTLLNIEDEKTILLEKNFEELLDEISLAIVEFGNLGGEVLVRDSIPFVKDQEIDMFLSELSVYTFTGIYQGTVRERGFYGPLPVLDNNKILMHSFPFSVKNQQAKDKRKKGMEPCILFVFYPRNYYFLFNKTLKIGKFLIEQFANLSSIEEIDDQFLTNLKINFKQFLTDIFV